MSRACTGCGPRAWSRSRSSKRDTARTTPRATTPCASGSTTSPTCSPTSRRTDVGGTYEVEYRVVTVKRVRFTVVGAESEDQARREEELCNPRDVHEGVYSIGMPPVEVEVEVIDEDD